MRGDTSVSCGTDLNHRLQNITMSSSPKLIGNNREDEVNCRHVYNNFLGDSRKPQPQPLPSPNFRSSSFNISEMFVEPVDEEVTSTLHVANALHTNSSDGERPWTTFAVQRLHLLRAIASVFKYLVTFVDFLLLRRGAQLPPISLSNVRHSLNSLPPRSIDGHVQHLFLPSTSQSVSLPHSAPRCSLFDVCFCAPNLPSLMQPVFMALENVTYRRVTLESAYDFALALVICGCDVMLTVCLNSNNRCLLRFRRLTVSRVILRYPGPAPRRHPGGISDVLICLLMVPVAGDLDLPSVLSSTVREQDCMMKRFHRRNTRSFRHSLP
ncbi:unnamed protein product [Soboliphyme baturini]|uniref:Uncharacterized protein n=1 Tax=Soboliphyme baturini TaxID=241478 RepID=A0A183IFU8_9BILA|nr:unnamed protein product [Soboliphyme baturini]